jgi:hypothetical protein
VHDRDHSNLSRADAEEDSVGKSGQERAPGVTINDREAERILRDGFQSLLHNFQEGNAETPAFALVPPGSALSLSPTVG